jgi:hypothetical protein
MKFSTYALSKFNSLKSYIDAVKSFSKMDSLAEETKGVSQFDLNSGSSKFQHAPHQPYDHLPVLEKNGSSMNPFVGDHHDSQRL